MIKTLTPEDIQNILRRLSVAIEIDQVYVDAMPRERFSPEYNDSMWRDWRTDHRAFVGRLVLTTDAILTTMLSELTEIAITREPARVRSIILELFAEVVGGHCSQDDFVTAEQFFGRLIKQTRDEPKRSRRHEGAQAAILQWLPVVDPLRISQDSECGYGRG